MRVESLELVDFRNYESFSLEPAEELTVLVGPNAVGKTNVIEAVQVMSSTTSFRKPKWEDLVRWGRERALLRMVSTGEQERVETRLEITAQGKRTYSVNGSAKRKLSSVAGIVPCVVFTPEDLNLTKGPAEVRRAAIDALGEQLSATYAHLRRDYSSVVRNRNRLLKDRAPAAEIEPWTHQLLALGSRLLAHRTRLLTRMREAVEERYRDLSGGESLAVEYVSKSGVKESTDDPEEIFRDMLAEIQRRAAEETARQTSLVGPHRDDIRMSIESRDARQYASQGQQRTISIAWKLAEVAVIEDVAKRVPVLLLDDVMSELDAVRRRALTEVVQERVQTFVTTTNIDYFPAELLSRAKVVELGREDG